QRTRRIGRRRRLRTQGKMTVEATVGDDLIFEQDGAVATLTINRPHVRNAMTFAMYGALAAHCRTVAADPSVRVLILRATGDKAFVSGTDIKELRTIQSGEDGLAYEAIVDAAIDALEAVEKPVLCAIRGAVTGGGLAIAAASDIRIATPDARLGIPIARTLGNFISGATLARVVASVGDAQTRRMLILGELVSAEEAHALGFLTELAAPRKPRHPRARSRPPTRRQRPQNHRRGQSRPPPHAHRGSAQRRRPRAPLLRQPRVPRGRHSVPRKTPPRLVKLTFRAHSAG
ncbi:MAG: enoyl-CoA hydratase-related protein, partial [Pseudomonadota bacterium]